MKTTFSVTTKPLLTVWSEPVWSRALHRRRRRRCARARGTPRALLRICPLQSSPDPGLVEAKVACLKYSRSGSAAGPSVNCDWLSRRLNILILGAVPFAEQGWGERRWRSGVNGARALFSTRISWIALRERRGNSRTLSSEFCGTNTLPPFRGQVARQARLG